MEDPYWKAVFPDRVNGNYLSYDIVFSGHSHCSHMFTKFYEVDCSNMRNRHAVMFINPGSIGQPRNHHPEAQYAVLDMNTLTVSMRSVPYNITKTMSYFKENIDIFYKEKKKKGI